MHDAIQTGLKQGGSKDIALPAFDEAPVHKGRDELEDMALAHAQNMLMTGPKATPPKFRRVRRIIRQMILGLPGNGQRIKIGGQLYHPTKGQRPNV